MEGRNILDQFSVFQFGKETVNIPMQKRQMFETEGLVSQFSTITTHLSFGPGVTCIHACFSFYTNINFTTTRERERERERAEAITKESIQEAFGILETSIESALKKFSDTVLHTDECVTRTICFKTGAERDTNKRFNRKRVTKKRDARRSLNRLKRTKPDVDRLTCRQKRAEYKSPVKEKKYHHKTSVH